MKKRILNDIKTEYKTFLEHLYFAENCLQELAEHTNKYLYDYSRTKNCDKNFAENIEINSLYFDYFLEKINNIIDDIEEVSIQDLEEPKINNVVNIVEYLPVPDNYEQDIYADINNPIDHTE